MKLTFIILVLALLFTNLHAEIEQDEIYISCSTPCIPKNNCYLSQCDTSIGVCVETIKETLPAECCFSANDCQTATCVYSSCNLDVNQCEYIEICPNSGFNITKKACVNDNQCQGDNPCYLSKCIDNICQNSPLTNPNNDLCCRTAGDCLPYPCSQSFCNIESFTCFYVPIFGCDFSLGESYIHIISNTVNQNVSQTNLTSTQLLYIIPPNPDAGDIFFTIIGCIALLLVIIIFICAVIYTIYDYFYGDHGTAGHDIGEAAAAGHTEHAPAAH